MDVTVWDIILKPWVIALDITMLMRKANESVSKYQILRYHEPTLAVLTIQVMCIILFSNCFVEK